MRKKPLVLLGLAVVAAVGVSWWVSRHTAALLRREPGISDDLATRPWVEEKIGLSGVVLDVPWHLQGVPVPLQKELSGRVSEWTWVGHEADGFYVLASRVTYAANVSPNLEGAADGMVKNVRAIPGTASVTPRRTSSTLLGRPAIELELQIEREKGEPLIEHGIVVIRGLDLIQVLSVSRADQPAAMKAWERMRDSVRLIEKTRR